MKITDIMLFGEAIGENGSKLATENVELKERIALLELLNNPWDERSTAGTDAIGEFTIAEYNAKGVPNPSQNAGYVILKELPEGVKIMGLPAFLREGSAVDLSNFKSGEQLRYSLRIAPANGRPNDSVFLFRLSRLILPETFAYAGYMFSFPPVACMLSKHATSNSSLWCNSATTITQIVKCPVGADVPYFLNKFEGITADDMVGIFENMIDRSNEETEAFITLGSKNLAKLTEEQKEIAYAKGWSLQ